MSYANFNMSDVCMVIRVLSEHLAKVPSSLEKGHIEALSQLLDRKNKIELVKISTIEI